MVIIDKEKAKDMYYANMMCEHHKVTEKIRLFTKKYAMSFEQFEKDIKQRRIERGSRLGIECYRNALSASG